MGLKVIFIMCILEASFCKSFRDRYEENNASKGSDFGAASYLNDLTAGPNEIFENQLRKHLTLCQNLIIELETMGLRYPAGHVAFFVILILGFYAPTKIVHTILDCCYGEKRV